MDVFAAIKKRRSIRAYQARPVPAALLRRVLEAARLAPSACNRQEWRFIAVRNRETIGKLKATANSAAFLDSAPVALVFCGTEGKGVMTCGQNTTSVDVSIAMSYVTLTAVAAGLGTCWLGSFREDEVKAILGIPREARVVAVTPLGYPAEKPGPRPRKKYAEVVRYDRW
jgi:nitroreductase